MGFMGWHGMLARHAWHWPGASAQNGSHFSRKRLNTGSLRFRLMVLLALAVLTGVLMGMALPHVSKPFAQMTGQYVAIGPAAEILAGLRTDDMPDATGYRREVFAYNTTDDDGNGCTVRDDVLSRDLEDVRYRIAGGCAVGSGRLNDPYTGKSIDFVRGKTTSSAVQIDHVVALENAWQSGAREWDTDRLQAFGNDTYNLLAVDGPANQQKGSASAAYWLPSRHSYQCGYVARQIGVKSAYDLTVTTPERQAMGAVLKHCPSQSIPEWRG